MPESSKIADLTEIATEILVNEIARRAEIKGMSVDALVSEAKANWNQAETDAENLLKKGHETDEK